ncbi:hypothetical protein [Escherichia coli]|uniref:hypothetical protein n=1 Tax=Escherichia coli TaxID=562 RepID=UPI0009082FDA|nr:hypothetical protein [Escherichia coli]
MALDSAITGRCPDGAVTAVKYRTIQCDAASQRLNPDISGRADIRVKQVYQTIRGCNIHATITG